MLETYQKDVTGENYHSLIEIASKNCDVFALVIRKDLFEKEEMAMKFYYKKLNDIQSSLIEMKEQSEWAVTRLAEATAYICYYELNEETKQFLQTKSNSLLGWMEGLPEDLMFYSHDQLWLAANSHEQYFIVNQQLEPYEELKNFLDNV